MIHTFTDVELQSTYINAAKDLRYYGRSRLSAFIRVHEEVLRRRKYDGLIKIADDLLERYSEDPDEAIMMP